jgi:L-fuconolactonase
VEAGSESCSTKAVNVIVDAHQHFWRVGHTQHDWRAPAMRALHRDFQPNDLIGDLRAVGVDATVVVQSANTVADTHWMLTLAKTTGFVAGVVGWIPLTDPGATRKALDDLAGNRWLCGIRHLINIEQDEDWLVRPEVLEGLSVVAERGLGFDLVPVTARQLEHVCTVAHRLPELRVVIDHLATPPLLRGGWEPWASLLAEAASHPNVAAKVSTGLDVVVDWDHWDLEEFRPYFEHAVERFGPDRLMAASNWPVILLAGDYRTVWEQTRSAFADLPARDR